MGPKARRVLHGVALPAIWRWAGTPVFVTPQARRRSTRDLMSHRSVPAFFDAAQDPEVQAAWARFTLLNNQQRKTNAEKHAS
eukprot:Skav220261  [mRNA]  locus=scaffold1696:482048:482293:+ [translate_table: standard]